MFVNGKKYTGNKDIEGVPEKLYDFERPQKPNEGKYGNRVGGLCIGKEIVDGIMSQLNKCDRYLEIGTFDGIALSVFAAKFPKNEFHAVDLFAGDGSTGGGCLNYFIRNCQNLDNIFLYYGKSVDVLKDVPGKFQIIFVDGSHKYENVKYDLFYAYENLLTVGGGLVFHDYSLKGVEPAVNELKAEYGLKVEKEPYRCNHFKKK